MSDVIKEYFESMFKTTASEAPVRNQIDNIVSTDPPESPQNKLSASSTYTMASDQSQMSRDVDMWLRGTTENTGVQLSPVPVTQRSTSAHISSHFYSTGMWYALALLWPFFSTNNYPQWRCSPSVILNTAQLFVNQIERAYDRVRCNIRRLAQNQMSRDLLATAMDLLLVVYAIGFLILSLYQASIIG